MSTPTATRRKKATNLSVDERVLKRARELGLNLSQVFESGLRDAIRRREEEQWRERNRAAISTYNEQVEAHGVFSDGLRTF